MNKKKKFRKHAKPQKRKVGRTQIAQQAIIKTLSYRAVFNYPLSFCQLGTYLISKHKVDYHTLRSALSYLVKVKKVRVKKNKYYLSSVAPVAWEVRYNSSKKLIEKAKRITRYLSKIPWIKFVGVSGSVAAFNGAKNEDIDIVVICKNKRLWLTRGFLFVVLIILGQLRTDKDPKRKICPNILLDERNLSWSKKRRNIYTAHEVVMLYPLMDRDNTYHRFLKSNEWIFSHFGNFHIDLARTAPIKKTNNIVLDALENLAYKWQLKYMKEKITTEITKKDIIHFNREDVMGDILESYKDMLSLKK